MLPYIYKVIPGILDYDVLPKEIPVLLREFGKLCLADEEDAGYFAILRKIKITLLKKKLFCNLKNSNQTMSASENLFAV
jgi:hypothetical protein